jgi:hypothetical protein
MTSQKDFSEINIPECVEMLTKMTKEEWDELVALKNVISYNPASVSTDKMEKFTELLVQSLYGKGENSKITTPTNY